MDDRARLADAHGSAPRENAVLQGYRIIDLSAGHAASVAAMMLAECGADVVKLSLKDRPSRLTGVQRAMWDRSKSMLSLDLLEPADRARFADLLAGADVLLHDLTPIEAQRLEVDEATLASRYPALISSSVTGWPAGHPKADRTVSEALVLAEAGIFDEQAAIGRDGPVYLRFPLGSWHAAGLAASGTITRLLMREKNQGAGPVRTSLIQGALIPQMMLWYRTERTGPGMVGWAKNHPVTLFECGDGEWIHVMGQPITAPLMRSGIDAMTPEARAVALAEFANVPIPFMAEWGAVKAIFKTRPRAEWLAHLWQHDVPAQAVGKLGEFYADEQAHANGYVVEIETAEHGRTLQPGVPLHIEPSPRPRAVSAVPSWPRRDHSSASNKAEQPLAGIKVVDFGNFLAGPLTAMLLADLGADVIKVEMPSGDPMRPIAWAFNGCQRGKRALGLQLKDAGSREIVERLVRDADIVHHNLRLPVAEKLGIGYEALKAINPKLIYSHVSSYGRYGERKDWPGYDQLFQAAAGWEYEGAGAGNPPIWHRFGMMDHLSAMNSLTVTLLALLHRQRTGEGQFVAASLLGASLFSFDTAQAADGSLLPYPKLDSRQLGLSPAQRLYACADGWIAVDDNADDAERRLLANFRAVDIAALELAIGKLDIASALAIAERAGVPAVRVNLSQQDAFLRDEANRRVGLSVSYPHPNYGWLEQPGAAWSFGEKLPLQLRSGPPLLGQHSFELLREYGYDDAAIASFIERGIVSAGAPRAVNSR
jgi:crotonobetainyl-CoA:carnitine CoA-transferase CaiB-like acyl-CoA transferase